MNYFTIIEKERTFVLILGDIRKEFSYQDYTIDQAKKLMNDRYSE